MRVLVSGTGGFIGSHLVSALSRAKIEWERLVFPIFKNISRYDAVIHCAGVMPRSDDETPDFSPNIRMAYDIKSLVNGGQAPGNVIHLSSVDVYGSEGENINESHACRPVTAYAASKLAAEYTLNGPHVTTLRVAQVYGPGEKPIKFIPRTLRAIFEAKRIDLHGMGESTRSYVYVDDVAAAVVHCLQHWITGGTYNVAGPAVTIKEIFETASKMIPNKATFRFLPGESTSTHLTIDSSKLASTGWSPTTRLQDGLLNQWNALIGEY